MTAPYPPESAPAAGNDRTTLWGVLGIVLGLCCGPLGIVFGWLSIRDAKTFGKSPVLGYIGIVIGVLNIIGGIIRVATGHTGLS